MKSSVGEAEKYEERAVESDKIGVLKSPESSAHIRPRHGRYLVDHDEARVLNPGRWG